MEKSSGSPEFIELHGEEFKKKCAVRLAMPPSSGDKSPWAKEHKECVNATTLFIEKFEFSVADYFIETERARSRYEEKLKEEQQKNEVSNSLNTTDAPTL